MPPLGAIGVLEKLRGLANFCQEETLRRVRGHIDLRILPHAVIAEIVIRAGQKYTQIVQFTDQQLIEAPEHFFEDAIRYAFNKVERAAQ